MAGEERGDDKGKLLVAEQVKSHGLGCNLILADGLKDTAIGGVDQQYHERDAEGCQTEYGKDIGEAGDALQTVGTVGDSVKHGRCDEGADDF